MRKLSEYKGEKAIEVIANIIEPAAAIMGDSKMGELVKQEQGKVKAVKHALKEHKKEVLQIMAVLDGVNVENNVEFSEYVENVNLLTLPKNLVELFNDPDIQSLFLSQEMNMDVMPSTPASEESQTND